MKLWTVELTCDHDLLIAAETEREALAIANVEASKHEVKVSLRDIGQPSIVERVITGPELLVIYPGPFSIHAVREGAERP